MKARTSGSANSLSRRVTCRSARPTGCIPTICRCPSPVTTSSPVLTSTSVGSNHGFANVHWACDQKLATNVLGLPSTLILEDNLLSFEVQARAACPLDQHGVGVTPTPPPRLCPPEPASSPTALTSPNPHHLVMNEVHFVVVDLHGIQGLNSLRVAQDIQFGSQYAVTDAEWNSWLPIPRPIGYHCLGERFANLWQCWFDETFEDRVPYKSCCSC